jgi:CelD/BcsL family acetyltransferase involved in cellulose biosynthesis
MSKRSLTEAPFIALSDDHPAAELPDIAGHAFGIDVIENATDFAALRDEWAELLASSRSDCMFLTWEWLHTWWTHLGQGKRLFIVTLRSRSQLVAIAPLVLRRAGLGPLTVPLLEFAGTGTIGSDYLDFIIRTHCEAVALRTLTSFLADTAFSIRLPRVNEDSSMASALSRGLVARGWECVPTPTDVCPFIDLSAGSFGSYLSTRGSSHRSNFRRSLRNLEKDHSVRLERATSSDERRAALGHLVNLHLQRWKTRGGSDAGFDDPNVLAFHDELSQLALERGWLRLLVLTVDGAAAAAFYGFRYGRTFHFYQSGFDPAFERSSVGLVTIGLTIRDAIEEGAAEYDLLHGNETYKFLWATEVHRLVRLELYPPGHWGRMHRNTARLTRTAKKLAKRVLRVAAAASPTTLK